jgi:steroid delta-isomerase-like uncharacterized protein
VRPVGLQVRKLLAAALAADGGLAHPLGDLVVARSLAWRGAILHRAEEKELHLDDVVYEDVTMGVVNRSKEELRAFGEGFVAAFPDVTFEPTAMFAAGSRGGAEWVMRGTHRGDLPGMPATAKRVELRGASIFASAEDKIRRCADHGDMATLREQLGFLPAG